MKKGKKGRRKETDRAIATVITLIAGANEVTACTMPGTIIEANILLCKPGKRGDREGRARRSEQKNTQTNKKARKRT